MTSKNSSGVACNERLNEVLAAYLEAIEAGEAVDQREWLRRYPDLAVELAEFFADRQRLVPLADPLRTATTVCPETGNGTPPGPGDGEGSLFGNYQILEEIARGGMGVVYRARQVGLKRVVALKMILAGQLAGAGALRRFRTEAEAVASFDHPNIVPIYEIGERDGNHYFTMKLINGGSLAEWLDVHRPPQARVSARAQADTARFLATVARAVHHAHQRGVLHRDLKPANILLQIADCRLPIADMRETPILADKSAIGNLQSAIPMVTDFGLAKRVGADGWAAQSQTIVGTANYMAPEQAATTDAPLTLAADVYSLGAVLYEMLTGQPPFQGDTYLSTLMQVVHEAPVPPRQLNRHLAPDLERICLKCLAKAPEQRYASAADLAADLENWAAGGPVSVRPQGRGERLWRWCRRKPLLAVLVVTVAGFLGAGAVYSTSMNVQLTEIANLADANAAEAARETRLAEQARTGADRARDKALAALQREQLALGEEKIQRAKSRQLLVGQYVSNGMNLLDGGDPLGALTWFGEALHLEQGDPALEAPHRIRLAAALRRCPRLIQATFHDGGVGAFCLSADGRRLFTADRAGPARLWDTLTEKAIPLSLGNGDRVTDAVFSPDNAVLVTAAENGTVRLWDAASGAVLGHVVRHTGGVAQLAFDRNGKHLLTAGRDGTVRVWSTAGGLPLSPSMAHGARVTFAAFSPDSRLVVTTGVVTDSGRAEVRVWDWAAGKQAVKPLMHMQKVMRAAFSPDGRRLFTVGLYHNLRSWDLTTGKPTPLSLAQPRGSAGPWFSPDGQRVVLVKGSVARVFDLNTSQPVGAPLTHGGDVLLAAFSPDGRSLVTAGWDRAVRVWDALSGQPLTAPLRHPRRVLGAAFDASGRLLVTGGEDGTVRLWDLRRRDQAVPPPLKVSGSVLAVAPGGRSVLAQSDGTWRVCAVGGEAPVSRPLPVAKVTQATFSPEGQRLATWDGEKLRLWDLTAREWTGRVLGPGLKVQQLTFSPDGRRVAARLASEQVRIWDVASGNLVVAGKPPGTTPWDVPVVTAAGGQVVTLKLKQIVQLWDLATGQATSPPFRHTSTVIHAACSPDGRRLANACADGTVHIWNPVTAEPLTPPLAHGPFLQLVGFSRDGRRLVTAGSDGTVRVWDASSGLPLTPLLRQTEPIMAATFSPDNDRLATVAKNGKVRLWDLRPDDRPAADLLQLTRLLSGQQIHTASGSLLPFDLGDLRQSWPQLRTRFPAEFGKD